MEIPFIWVLSCWNCQYLCRENKKIGRERVTLSYTSLKTEIIRRKTIVDYTALDIVIKHFNPMNEISTKVESL